MIQENAGERESERERERGREREREREREDSFDLHTTQFAVLKINFSKERFKLNQKEIEKIKNSNSIEKTYNFA